MRKKREERKEKSYKKSGKRRVRKRGEGEVLERDSKREELEGKRKEKN
jgi:hypothetical protein